MKLRSYTQAIEYLNTFIKPIAFDPSRGPNAVKDPLERMRQLLSRLGNPQDKFKSVHVTGTSGKGSTSYLIAHMLVTAGYTTGWTQSPHLERINERIQISHHYGCHSERSEESYCKRQGILRSSQDDSFLQPITDEEFVELVNDVQFAIEQMRTTKWGEPSHFEILIAMAFLHFAKAKVDIAVVEVGLGGEYDATNTIHALVSVITNISLDHTEILGKTVEEIAKTKAGIIKKFPIKNEKSIVVTGAKQQSVLEIIEKKSREEETDLLRLGEEFNYRVKEENERGVVFDYYLRCHSEVQPKNLELRSLANARLDSRFDSNRDEPARPAQDDIIINDLHLSLLGSFQAENAAVALTAVLSLQQFGFTISEEQIRQALATAHIPGRFEIINYNLRATTYNLILDGAHNPAKMEAFITSLQKIFPREKKIFIVSIKQDKDTKDLLAMIASVADTIILTKFTNVTYYSSLGASDPSMLVDQLKKAEKQDVVVEENLSDALEKAFEIASKDDLIVVTGSLYFVGEVRALLKK